MVAGSDWAGIKQQLAENPRRVPLHTDFVSDRRVITYAGKVRIWRCIMENAPALSPGGDHSRRPTAQTIRTLCYNRHPSPRAGGKS